MVLKAASHAICGVGVATIGSENQKHVIALLPFLHALYESIVERALYGANVQHDVRIVMIRHPLD
jgi:hypothetical protein